MGRRGLGGGLLGLVRFEIDGTSVWMSVRVLFCRCGCGLDGDVEYCPSHSFTSCGTVQHRFLQTPAEHAIHEYYE